MDKKIKWILIIKFKIKEFLMIELIFIRHSKIEYTHDDRTRKLSEEGKELVEIVNKVMKNIHIDYIYSSPYRRAIDTIKDVASIRNLEILIDEDLRERKVSDHFIDDFETFALKQWNDFDFKLPFGESLNEVKKRGISAINKIIDRHKNETIVIGTHGTFLAVYLNSLDPNIDFNFWEQIKSPDIVKVSFTDKPLIEFLLNIM